MPFTVSLPWLLPVLSITYDCFPSYLVAMVLMSVLTEDIATRPYIPKVIMERRIYLARPLLVESCATGLAAACAVGAP